VKSISLIAILFCISLISYFVPSCSKQVSTTEWIHAEGNNFVDESGDTVIFHGVNIRDPHYLEANGNWKKAHFEEALNWGSNVIRLPIHPGAWRERGRDAYLELLDQAVDWANELGLYLILDWHSIGNLKEEKFQREIYVTTADETYDFWNVVSKRYSEEPVVAMYELYNEPTVSGDDFGEMSWAEWKKMNEEMIRIIRRNHSRSLILVAGFDWAYELMQVKNDPIMIDNIAYVSHPYPEKREAPWESKWEEDWGFVAETYPVILTEIGFALPDERGAHIPVNGDETYGNAIVDYAAAKGISWVVWCFDPDWPPHMFTDWNYSPTRQGTFFRKAMTGK